MVAEKVNNSDLKKFAELKSPAGIIGGGMAGGVGGMFLLAGTPFLLPLVFPLAIAGGTLGCMTEKRLDGDLFVINGAIKKVKKAAKNLPAGPEKDLVGEFARVARATYLLSHASLCQQQIIAGKESARKLHKLHKLGLSEIRAAVKEMRWTAEQHDALQAAFRSGTFPRRSEFLERLQESGRQVETALADKITALKQAGNVLRLS